jgi:hypothetical protein
MRPIQVGSRAKAFKLVEKDHKLVRFYLPLKLETIPKLSIDPERSNHETMERSRQATITLQATTNVQQAKQRGREINHDPD